MRLPLKPQNAGGHQALGLPSDGRAPAAPLRPRRDASRLSPAVVTGLLRVADVLVVLLAALLAHFTRHPDLATPPAVAWYGMAVGMLLTTHVFQIAGLYRFDQLTNLFKQSGRLLVAWAGVILLVIVLGFFTRTLGDASRLWVGFWFLYGCVGLFTVRVLCKQLVRQWQAEGRLTRKVAVLGAGKQGAQLVQHLDSQPDSSFQVVGMFDDRLNRVPRQVNGYPVLGNVDSLMEFARRKAFDHIIVALPWDSESRLLDWMKKLQALPIEVSLAPQTVGYGLVNRPIGHVAGVPMVNLFAQPLDGWGAILKNLEDRMLASVILFLISPLMALIATLIKLDSKGPVFYRQKRYGLNNEVIEVFKFRSMYTDRSDDGTGTVAQASKHDPRVTRVGRVLRRTSLDELPQLLNVLGGTMSLVGPRPHAVSHNELYAKLIDRYLARHKVKPGITGWAQVNGLRGETDTVDKMERRVQHDLYYIENWSLLFDLRIILKTLIVGFIHKNAV